MSMLDFPYTCIFLVGKAWIYIATLGPSFGFSLAENMASLRLKMGHEMVLFSIRSGKPASLQAYLWKWNISASTGLILP